MARRLPQPVLDEEDQESGDVKEVPSEQEERSQREQRYKVNGKKKAGPDFDKILTFGYTNDKKYQWQKLLVAGMSKCGRTRFALTWPRPLILNTDKGLEAYSGQKIPVVTLDRSDKLPISEILMRFIMMLKYREPPYDKFFPETLIIDQATSLCDLLEEEVMNFSPATNKGEERDDQLFMKDYGIIQKRFLRFMDSLRDLPCHVIMITNTTFEKDPLLEGLYETPAVTGNKMSPQIPTYFGEVYYLKYSEKLGEYIAMIKPTSRFPYSGTRYDALKAAYPEGYVTDPSYGKFIKYYIPNEEYNKTRKKK